METYQNVFFDNDNYELVQIVDIDNKPVGPATTHEMREKRLIHRETYIFLENSNTNRFVTHQKSNNRKYNPGFWHLAFGGVLQYQESYEINAQRQLFQQTGLNEIVVPLFEFLCVDKYVQPVWGKVFYARTDKELKLNDDEIEQAVEMTKEQIIEVIQIADKITFDSKVAFTKFMESYQECKEKIEYKIQYQN